MASLAESVALVTWDWWLEEFERPVDDPVIRLVRSMDAGERRMAYCPGCRRFVLVRAIR